MATVVAAATALSALGVTGAGGSGPQARAAPLLARAPSAWTMQAAADRGVRLWLSRVKGGVLSMAVSPDGGTVFIAGGTGDGDYLTVAYGAATGAQKWLKRYTGPSNGRDGAASVAVSPDGSTVFVTGTSQGATTKNDYATVAYNAATGAQLWAHRYNGPANGYDAAQSVLASPRGSAVFVTGTSDTSTGVDYATAAYDAVTGAQLWARRYTGEPNMYASAAVSPDGSTVFVTGTRLWRATGEDYATVAYNAVTGAQLWAARYTSGTGKSPDLVQSVAVSPDGNMVYVTGASSNAQGYATVAYNAATGAQLWVARYNYGFGLRVAASPDGRTVFVTGSSADQQYATVAYNAVTGAQLWTARYTGPSYNSPSSMAVSPDGRTLYVTGYSQGGAATDDDYATVAYGAVTGAQLWAQRWSSHGSYADFAVSVAVSPTGRRVFVTGFSQGGNSRTIAYTG
ncbi:MAG TPA: PQQ-binding-like beta-propeller repeat protein [Streptosporangiaceae bacterium]|nr:PQQ-binding-like beta-propeller repeat protein [Streptosporangiaceae bacterium]